MNKTIMPPGYWNLSEAPQFKDFKDLSYQTSKTPFRGKSKPQFRESSRRSICVDAIHDFIHPRYPKSEETFEFLRSVVQKNFVLKSLNDEQCRTLIQVMSKVIYPRGSGIIQQGDETDFFYIVEKGIVEFFVNWKDSGTCGPGESFGELELLNDSSRAASCIAGTDCTLWRVDIRFFRSLLTEYELTKVKRICDMLRNVPYFFNLDKRKLIEMIQACNVVKFKEGERIATKGQVGQKIHIVREGKVKVHDIGFKNRQTPYVDYILGPGNFFCERALWHVTAVSNCTTLSFSLKTYEKMFGSCNELINCLVTRNMLMGVPMFANSKLEPHLFSRLADLFTKTCLEVGMLVEEGGPVAKQGIYIIQNGCVVITNSDRTTRTLSRGDYFGDSFLQVEEGCISKQTIRIEKQAICAVLTKSSIESVIGTVSNLVKPLPTMKNLDNSISIDDLCTYRIIGVGSFSTVRLASHKYSQKPYALKTISKYEVIQENRVESIIRGKNIMASIDHPFIVNLVSTFQDDYMLYMLFDFVPGGELLQVISPDRGHGILIDDARFYAANILEALSHLHHHHICYRNLTPDNILIDKEGYCVLTNFKYAKVVFGKTYTFLGACGCVSPEIILGKGHNKGADYWALGILIYEMLLGHNPFYTDGIDQVKLFKRIVKAKYSLPMGSNYGKSTEKLIGGLLSRDQASRLGCISGDLELRKHQWFAHVDFGRILKKKVQPPWMPIIKGKLDPSNFDSYDDFENNYELTKERISAQRKIFQEF